MDQVDDVWMRRLLQISSDIHYRMGEVRKLRQLVALHSDYDSLEVAG